MDLQVFFVFNLVKLNFCKYLKPFFISFRPFYGTDETYILDGKTKPYFLFYLQDTLVDTVNSQNHRNLYHN